MQRATVNDQNDRKRSYAAQETRELLEVLHGDYSNLSRLAQLYVRIVLTEAAQRADAVAAAESKRNWQLNCELKQCRAVGSNKRKTTKTDFENLQGRKKNKNDEHN